MLDGMSGSFAFWLLLAVLAAFLFYLGGVKTITIYEFERGLLYRNGKYDRILEPGRHTMLRFGIRLFKVDVRQQIVTIPGQDVLSADNVSIKVSLAATYKVGDPYLAINETASYHQALYQLLQLEARNLIGSTPIDELLAKREEIGAGLLKAARPPAKKIGVELVSVGIKDVMFPGELKNIFAQVVNARKEGLAALERARGESAALRNLANTAKLLENNPALLQLRVLQSLGEGSGNTLVLKLGDEPEIEIGAPKKASGKRK